MSRNRNSAIELVFLLIKDRFDLTAITGEEFNKTRWVKGDEVASEWLTDCRLVDTYSFSAHRQFCTIEFGSKRYFAATGFGEPDTVPIGLESIEINPGLFVALVSELELPIPKAITPKILEEKILSQHVDSDQYSGHEVHELVTVFPDIFVAEVTKDFFGDPKNLIQLAAYYLATNRQLLSIPFKDSTLDEVVFLLSTNSNILNYENILQALLASQFKFAFLDLYRCIELLYQVIYISKTSSALGMPTQQFKVLSAIDETLGWRPVESVSLRKIFTETPKPLITSLGDAIRSYDGNVGDYSKWLYMLRNNIVHLKPTHQSVYLKDSQWEPIICGLVRILKFWYQKYNRFD